MGDGRVLMSVSVPGGAIPTGLTADSRVWLLVTIGGACQATTVVVDATVIAVGRQSAAASADSPDRHVALTVEVPPNAVSAVGTADAVTVALWTRDDHPAAPSSADEREQCSDGTASAMNDNNAPGAPPTTGTFLVAAGEVIIPPTSTSVP